MRISTFVASFLGLSVRFLAILSLFLLFFALSPLSSRCAFICLHTLFSLNTQPASLPIRLDAETFVTNIFQIYSLCMWQFLHPMIKHMPLSLSRHFFLALCLFCNSFVCGFRMKSSGKYSQLSCMERTTCLLIET